MMKRQNPQLKSRLKTIRKRKGGVKMSTFIERMKNEKEELDIKMEKLADFLEKDNTEKLTEQEIELLIAQHNAMQVYSFILKQRIALY